MSWMSSRQLKYLMRNDEGGKGGGQRRLLPTKYGAMKRPYETMARSGSLIGPGNVTINDRDQLISRFSISQALNCLRLPYDTGIRLQ